MSTVAVSKKRFLAWLESQIEDDEIILMTQDLEGNLSVSEKRNVKKVTFGFAADAFKRKGDIGHFAFGKTPVFACAICKPVDVSQAVIEIVKK